MASPPPSSAHKEDRILAAQTPILTLPDDILYSIFGHCILLSESNETDFYIAMSHVCPRWRQLVVATGHFWTDIDLDTESINMDLLETKIRRSGDALFHINISSLPFQRRSIPTIREVCRIIIPHVARWKSLKIREVPFKIINIIFNHLRTKQLPHLETLSVFSCPHPGPGAPIKLSRFDFPALKHLTLLISPFLPRSAPFSQLITIRIDTTHHSLESFGLLAEEALKILRAAPYLRGLSLEAEGIFPGSDSNRLLQSNDTSRINHSSLEILGLPTSQAVDIVLQSAELPSLRRLPQSYGWPSNFLPAIMDDMTLPKIERLILFGNGADALQDLVALVQCSELQELRLTGYVLSFQSLQTIAREFAQLQSFEICHCQGWNWSDLEDFLIACDGKLAKLIIWYTTVVPTLSEEHRIRFKSKLAVFECNPWGWPGDVRHADWLALVRWESLIGDS